MNTRVKVYNSTGKYADSFKKIVHKNIKSWKLFTRQVQYLNSKGFFLKSQLKMAKGLQEKKIVSAIKTIFS